LLFIVSFVAFGLGGVYSAVAVIIIYTLILGCVGTVALLIVRIVVSLIRPELRTNLWSWAMVWFRRLMTIAAFFLILMPLVFIGLVYGFNEWWPGTLTRYELTN